MAGRRRLEKEKPLTKKELEKFRKLLMDKREEVANSIRERASTARVDENDLLAAAAPVDDIERALSHLLAAQTAAESVMPGAGKPVTAAGKDVAPILRDLRTALAEGDTHARASLEQLEQMLDDPPPVLSTIRALMTAYAFEEASREIDTLAAALGVEV